MDGATCLDETGSWAPGSGLRPAEPTTVVLAMCPARPGCPVRWRLPVCGARGSHMRTWGGRKRQSTHRYTDFPWAPLREEVVMNAGLSFLCGDNQPITFSAQQTLPGSQPGHLVPSSSPAKRKENSELPRPQPPVRTRKRKSDKRGSINDFILIGLGTEALGNNTRGYYQGHIHIPL